MTAVRLSRPRSGLHADSPARRLLAAYLVSLLLHGLLLLGLTGGWLNSTPRPDQEPVYYVDLVHKPVLNPQAGRPEPRAATRIPPAPAPTAPAVAPKTAVTQKAAPAARTPARPADSHVQDALEQLRLQQRLAALRQTQAVPMDTPVGLPDAKGTEAGVYSETYIREYIRQNWALSPYVLGDAKRMGSIEAWVRLSYNKAGKLLGFRFEKGSGDNQFDESIKRALVKSQQLPVTLPVPLEDRLVIFNLKQLAETPR